MWAKTRQVSPVRPVGRTYHSDYATRVRALTSEIRESCPNPTDLDVLAAFISKNLPEDKLAACMTEFDIRSAANREKDKFSRALAAQFSLFVTSQDDDVTMPYGRYIRNFSRDSRSPLMTSVGQDMRVTTSMSNSEAIGMRRTAMRSFTTSGSYRTTAGFHDNRKLVLVNQQDIHPRPIEAKISVPDTSPGGFTKIATDI